jgi:ubiquinone/menaquinone biosynthesis C-methylase UbiE
MEAQLMQIRDQQKESWNKFSPGWKKWDELMMDFLKPMGDEIIRRIDPHGADLVLDIASGTGEPALTIATMLTTGKVILTDVADEMLDIAKENAALRGITNIETVPCDVCELPFPDNSFDSISCRFGFMFFPDMMLAAKEMVRVLKPGGKIATSVWDGPEKNFWITAIMGTINKNIELPPTVPGAPGMFRCAAPGMIAGLFRDAGLRNVGEAAVAGKLQCKTNAVYWSTMTEVGAPIVAALSRTDDPTREKIRQEVCNLLSEKYPEGSVVIDSGAIVIYGEK